MQPPGWHQARGASWAGGPGGGGGKLGVEFRGEVQPGKAGRLRARVARASPTGRGTAGEREAVSDAGAGSRRPRGAAWGGRRRERAEPSGKGAGDRDEAPLPSSRPTAHRLRETDALPLGLLSHTLRRRLR